MSDDDWNQNYNQGRYGGPPLSNNRSAFWQGVADAEAAKLAAQAHNAPLTSGAPHQQRPPQMPGGTFNLTLEDLGFGVDEVEARHRQPPKRKESLSLILFTFGSLFFLGWLFDRYPDWWRALLK